ncbi:MAG: PspC domain-containing protein [Micropruina sp.]|nr:MAG: PspC domain-containing protein [Micropruina sp.]
MNGKKLTRSRTDKFLGGVCGGLANYLGMDSGIVRLITVLVAVFTQVGWMAYLVAWALLPAEGGGPTGFEEAKTMFTSNSGNSGNPNNMSGGEDLR